MDGNDLKDLKSFFANRTKEIKEEKNQTLSIIAPHLADIDNANLSEIEKQQAKKTLSNLSSFIQSYDTSINIERMEKKPLRFVLRKNKKIIEIKSTDINHTFNQTIENLLLEIEQELKTISPELSGVYNIDFNDHRLTGIDNKIIKTEIIEYILDSKPIGNNIKEIQKSSGNLHLHTNTSTVTISKKLISTILTEQDQILDSNQTKNTEYWLLLVADSNDAITIENTITEDSFVTKYDKTLIFIPSQSKTIELKK